MTYLYIILGIILAYSIYGAIAGMICLGWKGEEPWWMGWLVAPALPFASVIGFILHIFNNIYMKFNKRK